MNHYIIRAEGGVDRVHFQAVDLSGAVKDCLIYTRVASPEVRWYVLSTARQLIVGRPVGEGSG